MRIDKRSYPKHVELLRKLGPGWKLQRIDGEVCVYRDLGNGYDIEISGVGSASNEVTIYVWDISGGDNYTATIVHIEREVHRSRIKSFCEELLERYGKS